MGWAIKLIFNTPLISIPTYMEPEVHAGATDIQTRAKLYSPTHSTPPTLCVGGEGSIKIINYTPLIIIPTYMEPEVHAWGHS